MKFLLVELAHRLLQLVGSEKLGINPHGDDAHVRCCTSWIVGYVSYVTHEQKFSQWRREPSTGAASGVNPHSITPSRISRKGAVAGGSWPARVEPAQRRLKARVDGAVGLKRADNFSHFAASHR